MDLDRVGAKALSESLSPNLGTLSRSMDLTTIGSPSLTLRGHSDFLICLRLSTGSQGLFIDVWEHEWIRSRKLLEKLDIYSKLLI